MYFVDREKIETILGYFEQQIGLFEQLNDWSSLMEKAALERITHMLVEAILDVGNDMIDGFIMRDPGSYEDIIDILTDEKVITEEMSVGFKKIITYRKKLVQRYTDISHDQLQSDFEIELPMLKQFAPKVRDYLLHQLGPVSAFKN